MTQTAGTIVGGKYQLERLLARGGMGSVWVAVHCQLDVHVALKFMEATLVDKPEARRRFEREAKAAAKLRSPHVVQILDYGLDDGSPYIAMELLQGEDLRARLERCGTLPLLTASHILTQSCKALRLAADAGIIHRDLKPGNIFLARSGDEETVKILDFGAAKAPAVRRVGHGTQSGVILGSPHYMSPEQARGVKQLDHRSDLFSMAVILFQMITGEKPFPGEELGDVICKICSEPLPVPSHYDPTLPRTIDDFFARGWARNPDERFQSAQQLATEFATIVSATPIPEMPSYPGMAAATPSDIAASISRDRRPSEPPDTPSPSPAVAGPVESSSLAAAATLLEENGKSQISRPPATSPTAKTSPQPPAVQSAAPQSQPPPKRRPLPPPAPVPRKPLPPPARRPLPPPKPVTEDDDPTQRRMRATDPRVTVAANEAALKHAGRTASSVKPQKPPGHDAELVGRVHGGTAPQAFTQTVVTPYLAHRHEDNTTLVWCPSFQQAFNRLGSVLRGKVKLDDNARYEAVSLVARLNAQATIGAGPIPGLNLARAGEGPQALRAVTTELARTFGTQAWSDMRPRDVPEHAFFVYAYVFKNLVFKRPLLRNSRSGLTTMNQRVECFGLWQEDDGGSHWSARAEQIRILDYHNDNEFVLEIATPNADERFIISRTRPKQTLDETVRQVLERCRDRRSLLERFTKTNQFKPDDVFVAPVIQFIIQRTFRDLTGAGLTTVGSAGKRLVAAKQCIGMKLDHKRGARPSRREKSFPRGKGRNLILNGPFLLLQTTAELAPRFALWIANNELLNTLG